MLEDLASAPIATAQLRDTEERPAILIPFS